MVVYRDRDIDSMQDSETFFTVDSKVLTIRRNQDGKKGDLQIEVKHPFFQVHTSHLIRFIIYSEEKV